MVSPTVAMPAPMVIPLERAADIRAAPATLEERSCKLSMPDEPAEKAVIKNLEDGEALCYRLQDHHVRYFYQAVVEHIDDTTT